MFTDRERLEREMAEFQRLNAGIRARYEADRKEKDALLDQIYAALGVPRPAPIS